MSTDADDWEDEQEPVDEWEDAQEPAEPAGDAFHDGWLMMEEPTDQPMTRLIPARGTPRPTCTSRISEMSWRKFGRKCKFKWSPRLYCTKDI